MSKETSERQPFHVYLILDTKEGCHVSMEDHLGNQLLATNSFNETKEGAEVFVLEIPADYRNPGKTVISE